MFRQIFLIYLLLYASFTHQYGGFIIFALYWYYFYNILSIYCMLALNYHIITSV